MRKTILSCLFCAGLVLGMISNGNAISSYLGDFENAYPGAVGSIIDSCTLCHTSPPARNSYGSDFGSNGHSFSAIEPIDSDNDGFANSSEIIALTFPGDPSSFPSNIGKSGWWWNAGESGRGIAIEIQGNSLFMAWYTYDQATGEPMWISSGGVMTDANHYTGPMWKYRNGQCIGCPYQAPDPPETIGTLSITFQSDHTATLTCPGVNLSLERFIFGAP
jgi:hypothetical protein